MTVELKAAHRAFINGSWVRFYVDSEDLQLPWCSWSDILVMLNLPCRAEVTATLAASYPESFRRTRDAGSAVSTFAAVDLLDDLALPEIRSAWREANVDVMIAQAGGYDELGMLAMAAARDRSAEIEDAAWARLHWH